MPDSSRSSAEPILRVKGVFKSFGELNAVDGIDLDVGAGEFLSFLGPSGCGKTTLLRIIAGFERPDGGTVEVGGKDITALPPNRRPLNLVFQRYALFPHLTVEDNVAFGLRLKKQPRSEIAAKVRAMLELVQLTHCAARYPDQISGGQAQRVALARALANEPKVLLLDEPLTALDRAVRGELQDQLKRIQREVGTTFIYVTHDQEEAMAMSSRIALMSEGRLKQLGSPSQLYSAPASTFAAGFVGDANLLSCETRAGQLLLGGVALGPTPWPANGTDPSERRVMVRPEDIELAREAGQGGLIGDVEASTFHGFYWMHRVRTEHVTLVAREISATPAVAVDQRVAITFQTARAVALDD